MFNKNKKKKIFIPPTNKPLEVKPIKINYIYTPPITEIKEDNNNFIPFKNIEYIEPFIRNDVVIPDTIFTQQEINTYDIPIEKPQIFNVIPETNFNEFSTYFQQSSSEFVNLTIDNNLNVGNTITSYDIFNSNNIITTDFTNLNNMTSLNLSVLSGEIYMKDNTGNLNLLNTIDGNLYFNNELLAKANDIQDIADWSLYPALEDVDMNFKKLVNVEEIDTANLIVYNNLTGNVITGQYADIDKILSFDIEAPNFNGFNIKGVNVKANVIDCYQLNAVVYPSLGGLGGGELGGGILSTTLDYLTVQGNTIITNNVNFGVDTLTTDTSHNLLYNGQIVQTGDAPIPNTITGINTFDVADRGIDITDKSTALITAKNGLGGEIILLADTGYLGANGGKVSIQANGGQLFGEVDITANDGTAGGIATGGAINLIANSGGALETLTSKITLNAGGINIYSGIGSPFGSLFGYTYINASLGISLVAGAFTSGLQSAGTVYLYGTNGIVLGTDTYARTIYPYSGGLTSENLIIKGRTLPTVGTVYLEDVDHIYMTGAGNITGVNNINGSAYPPTVDIGVSSLNTLTGAITLTAGTNINLVPVGNDITINATSTSTPAVGGVGAIQYSNGSGVFQGSANILYNGDTKITNAIGTNFIDMNEVANLNSIAIESTNQVNITGTTLLGLNSSLINISAGSGLRTEINGSYGTAGQVLTSDGTYTKWQNVVSNNNGVPYSLTGTTAGAVIVNRATGAGNPMPINTFNVISTITFKLPTILNPTESIYYDGWCFTDFDANFNSYWGVSYTTNIYAIPTDILGSTTNVNNALNFSNIQQIYLPLNLIIPPTHIVGGGTITLRIYCNPTSNNHYLTVAPINTARIGIVID